MDHLTQAELNDCARSLERGPHTHLAECMECASLLSFIRKLSESVISIDATLEPVHETEQAPVGLKPVLARLIFLHIAEPKHALYRYDDYCIDACTEEQTNSIKTYLVGQIASQRNPFTPLANIPIKLLSGKRVLQQTTCNGIGEFAFLFVTNPRLRLRFDLADDGLSIEAPLKELDRGS